MNFQKTAPHPDPPVSENRTRRYDNDWLTVLAMLTVFLFHCARFFNNEDWHVKNIQLSEGLSFFVSFTGQWIMPLFFLLSGISSFYSLKARPAGQYLCNRFRRLAIPFVFGTLVVLVPVQVWMERVSHAQFQGSFIEFYPRYFDGFYAFGGNFAWMGLHLWYLEILFVLTLLTLPVLLFLKKERPSRIISGMAGCMEKYKAAFLFGLPIWLMEVLVSLQPDEAGRRDFGGWSALTYLVVFVLGFILASDSRFRAAIARTRLTSLILAFLTTSLIFVFPLDLSSFGPVIKSLASLFLRSFNSWFWLSAILGYGSTYLNFSNRLLTYSRTAVLPFYVLHQTIIVTIGFFISQWKISVMIKYLMLSSLSFVLVMVIYHLVIRRIGRFAFLFGMKSGIS